MLLGNNRVSAQIATEKLSGTPWVLQNPQIASQWEGIFFVDNGTLLYYRRDVTKKNSPVTEYTGTWKITDEKKGQITLNISNTLMKACFGVTGNRLLLTELVNYESFFFSKGNSPDDKYLNMAIIAIQQYGENATLKNGGLAGPPFQGATYFIP